MNKHTLIAMLLTLAVALLAVPLEPASRAAAMPGPPIQLTPVNDDYAHALALSSALPATATGTNGGATTQTGESIDPLGAGKTVWWKWTAPTSGTVVIGTAGSDYDTFVTVYTGSTLATLDEVGHDDDTGPGNTSMLTLDAVQGTTYDIQVDGFFFAATPTGAIALAVVAADGALSGTVTGPDHAPAPAVCVHAAGAWGDYSYQTTADGAFSLPVPAGDYPTTFVECGNANLAPVHTTLTVTAGAPTPHTVVMPAGAQIRGTVTLPPGAPPQTPKVVAIADGSQDPLSAVAGPDGSFTLVAPGTGSYRIAVRYEDGANSFHDLYFGGTEDPNTAQELAVNVGCEYSGMDFDAAAGTVTTPADSCAPPPLGSGTGDTGGTGETSTACTSAAADAASALATLLARQEAVKTAKAKLSRLAKKAKRRPHLKKRVTQARRALKTAQRNAAAAAAVATSAQAAKAAVCR